MLVSTRLDRTNENLPLLGMRLSLCGNYNLINCRCFNFLSTARGGNAHVASAAGKNMHPIEINLLSTRDVVRSVCSRHPYR